MELQMLRKTRPAKTKLRGNQLSTTTFPRKWDGGDGDTGIRRGLVMVERRREGERGSLEFFLAGVKAGGRSG
jgi:hypothetical protein